MWTYLVGLERIRCDLRSISLDAMVNPRATLAERKHWALDLRKGKMNVYGGMLRFFDLLAKRNSSNFGRAYALTLLGLLRTYVDAVLPDQPAQPTAQQPPRVWRSDIAAKSAESRRTA
jgi:hypothetical protein